MAGFYVSDGISWHRSVQFKQWCDRCNIELYEWPDGSPEFNAIELVWNIIKQKMKSKNPNSQNELDNAVDEVLQNFSSSAIESCIIKTQEIYQQFISLY